MNQAKADKIGRILMPLLLIVYSMMLINQGLTVTDTGYNYGNFQNFGSLDGMWKFSTFLATALGAFFTALPFGNTMLGLNFYTCLIKTATALVAYWLCVKKFKMNPYLVFCAELMALGYCWCPTALVYNYLTYFLFTVGAMVLCLAVKQDKNYLFVVAGACLGLNVMVRLPNLAEMGLIAALWIDCFLKKLPVKEWVKKTGLCILGYVIGFGGILVLVFAIYGPDTYLQGIAQMLKVSGEAGGYSLKEMIIGDLRVYVESAKWLVIAGVLVVAGTVGYCLRKDLLWLKRVVYALASIIMLLFFYHRRLFSLSYYSYDAMNQIGFVFLLLSGLICLYVLFFGGKNYENRMMAAVVGIIILITPLGSNNYLYSAANNLFFVTPFIFTMGFEMVSKGKAYLDRKQRISLEPLKITLWTMILLACVQGVLFGATFVFRDGTDGTKRTYLVQNNEVLAGMYTTRENGEMLQALNDYLKEEKLEGEDVILYYNVPSLAFFMSLKPVLSTTWPDLESFSAAKMEEEMKEVSQKLREGGEKPLIIMGCEPEGEDAKMKLIRDFVQEFAYEQVFSYDSIFVYR